MLLHRLEYGKGGTCQFSSDAVVQSCAGLEVEPEKTWIIAEAVMVTSYAPLSPTQDVLWVQTSANKVLVAPCLCPRHYNDVIKEDSQFRVGQVYVVWPSPKSVMTVPRATLGEEMSRREYNKTCRKVDGAGALRFKVTQRAAKKLSNCKNEVHLAE